MPAGPISYTGKALIDGVLGDARWTQATLTYGFPMLAIDYGSGYAILVDDDNNPATPPVTVNEPQGLRPLNATQMAAAAAAFDLLAQYTNITVVQAPVASTAEIRIAGTTMPYPGVTTAYAYLPGDYVQAGDVWLTTANYNDPVAGTYAYFTFLHEIGHTLGLKHGHQAESYNSAVLPADRDSLEFSVMTYRSYAGAPIGAYSVSQGHFPQTFMIADIAALQLLYGADFTTNAGDTTYRFDPNTGETFINGAGQGAPSNGASPANIIFRTIWDGDGLDTYDFSAYGANAQLLVDLAPGGWTDVDADSNLQAAELGPGQVARGQIFNALQVNGDPRSLIENAIGGAGGDSLRGNAAANRLEGRDGNDSLYGYGGDDQLIGGAGDDRLDGGSGANRLDGGAGNDTAVFSSAVYASLVGGFANHDYGPPGVAPRVDTLIGIENLVGSAFNDTLYGNSGANRLEGGDGNDLLEGGLGDDQLIGGAGVDTASYRGATGPLTLSLALTGPQNTGSAGADTLSGVENLAGGAYDDTLTGDAGNNVIDGGGGHNILAGGAGIDTVSYASFAGEGTLIVNLASGIAYNSLTSGANDPLDRLSGFENIAGSYSSDDLTGDAFANILLGGYGSDTLDGAGGNDIIDGGYGFDRLTGGGGADIFRFGFDAVASDWRTAGIDTRYSGVDIITDFSPAQGDKLGFGLDLFTGGLTLGADILYNSATGALFYDFNDDHLFAGGEQLATIGKGLVLSQGDIVGYDAAIDGVYAAALAPGVPVADPASDLKLLVLHAFGNAHLSDNPVIHLV